MSEIIEFLITNLISLGASSLESPSKNGCYQEDVRELKQQLHDSFQTEYHRVLCD